MKKVANVDDEEIAHIRAKVRGHARDAPSRPRAQASPRCAGAPSEATEATDAYVHENPWAAVGIAAAVGIIIGFVASRR